MAESGLTASRHEESLAVALRPRRCCAASACGLAASIPSIPASRPTASRPTRSRSGGSLREPAVAAWRPLSWGHVVGNSSRAGERELIGEMAEAFFRRARSRGHADGASPTSGGYRTRHRVSVAASARARAAVRTAAGERRRQGGRGSRGRSLPDRVGATHKPTLPRKPRGTTGPRRGGKGACCTGGRLLRSQILSSVNAGVSVRRL